MLSLDDFKEVLQLRREFNAVRDEWKRTLSDYYARKFDPDQPRVPAGSSEGGRWASGASGFRDWPMSEPSLKGQKVLQRATRKWGGVLTFACRF